MEQQLYHSLTSIPLTDAVKQEYREYQIYTLMDRAIPYLKDGLKPCQRRILYTLWKNNSKGLMKVSSATGLVLTLHPHGPQSIEASIVNLAQDFTFSNNYPLIDKKGYFGERMEQEPAASRYIECKLGKVADILLFDDINQLEMVPNYDEKVMEPIALLPKLPLMLLNGAEGIGTGFSSVIPSFNHKDIADSMISVVKTGRPKKIKPWVRNFSMDLDFDDSGRILTQIHFEERDGSFFITELPRGYDAQRIYKHLNRLIDKDELKDFIDSSVDNYIQIELIFKRGVQVTLEEVQKKMGMVTSLVPNYTLISERGVKVFNTAEEIVTAFTLDRLKIVKRRYELWAQEATERLQRNNEIIRFIQEKHYAYAQKCSNRKEFTDYLGSKKFVFSDYLADMAIYRLTKEEVSKREALIKEDTSKLREYRRIFNSEALIKEKLIEELLKVKQELNELFVQREKERMQLYKKLQDKEKKGDKKRIKKN